MDLQSLERTSPDLIRTTLAMHGERGRQWLARIPAIVSDLAEQWSLRVGDAFPNLSYNFVAPAEAADGVRAVLKINAPNPDFLPELAALRHYDGHGCCLLLAADPAERAVLLERLEPGHLLSSLTDDAVETSIAAGVMRRLWRPAPPDHPFPTIEQWGEGFGECRARFGGPGPLPAALFDRAEKTFGELAASSAAPVVLHGDLHHFNILAAEREPWLAIDPKGVIGEPAYEVGALLRNPMPDVADWPDLGRVMARRVAQLADELGIDRERIAGWGMAQAILSAWWCIEDGACDPDIDVRVAEAIIASQP